MADLYGYTLEYSLYRLTFSQAIALIDIRNERERRAQEAAEEQSKASDPDYVNPDKYKVTKDTPTEALPTLSDLRGAFGGMFGR